MAVILFLGVALIGLLTYIAIKFIQSSYERAEVFRAMSVKYIPPLASRWTAMKNIVFARDNIGEIDAKQVREYGKVFGKLEINIEPIVMIAEPDLLRDVFVKQFNSFCNRRPFPGGGAKLFRDSVFFQRDQRWRDIRSLISPTFSTAKLHTMDSLISNCLEIVQRELNTRLNTAANTNDEGTVEIDAKNYFSNFAMDVVGTVFFGVDVDAINKRDHPFVRYAFDIFHPSNIWRILLFIATPGQYLRGQLARRGLIGMRKPTRTYFEDVIPNMVRERRTLNEKSNNNARKDFISVLISAREKAMSNEAMTATGDLRDDALNLDAGADTTTSVQAEQKSQKPISSDTIQATKSATAALTDDEIAGQIFIFLVAGFETTATTMGFLFHELSLNQEIQERLRREVNDTLDNNRNDDTDDGHKSALCYASVADMPLLDACINETLRLYPPVARLERQCADDCTLSNGMLVKKGVLVGIPAYYIHHSPDNFVDPEKFDPDRFFDAERRAQIKPYTFMPFGQGPRNCVGMRFALLELKMVAAFVVRNYRIVPTEKTVHPIPLEPRSMNLTRPRFGAFVGIERLKNV